MKAIHRICEWIANHLPNFGEHTIYDANGKLYLRRIYLTPRRKDSKKPWWPGIFLHHFYRSDADRFPHNHPWQSSISIILAGGYTEHRYYPEIDHPLIPDPVPEDFRWTHRNITPISVNKIDKNTFHRVDLLDSENGAWSLFCAFEATQDWGFWDTDNNKFIPWYTYLGKDANGLERD